MNMKRRIIGIDPSINNIGIAVLTAYDNPVSAPDNYAIVERLYFIGTDKDKTREERLLSIGVTLNIINKVHNFGIDGVRTEVVCESQRLNCSNATVVFNTIVPLSTAAGFIVGTVFGLLHMSCSLELPQPNKWKGNLPKDVIRNRFVKIAPSVFHKIKDDTLEALYIAIGKSRKLEVRFDGCEYHEWQSGAPRQPISWKGEAQ